MAFAPQLPSRSAEFQPPFAQSELSLATKIAAFWYVETSTKVRDDKSELGKDIAEGTYSEELQPPHFKTVLAAVTTTENGVASVVEKESAVVLPMLIARGVAE